MRFRDVVVLSSKQTGSPGSRRLQGTEFLVTYDQKYQFFPRDVDKNRRSGANHLSEAIQIHHSKQHKNTNRKELHFQKSTVIVNNHT